MPDLRDLEIMMDSRVPIIVIETHEEPRALELVRRAGIKQHKPVFSWSVTEGVKRMDLTHSVPEHLTNEPDAASQRSTAPPRSARRWARTWRRPGRATLRTTWSRSCPGA